MEEMKFIVDAAKEGMEQAVVHLEKEMLNIRAGKANPIMLSSVKVDYYGTPTLISQVANVNSPDGRTLTVQPWEKGMLQEIEKAILVANLGFNPMNNGESIIINIPPLTEERRRDLAKLAKAETENFRKRSIDEMDKTRKYAIENFASEILLVKDSLDASLMVDESSLENYKEGMELTSKQLTSVFEKLNIKEIDPKGEVFDPNFHEAMTMVESDQDANTVISVMQKGYTLNERVLRPALVTVAKEKN